MAKVPSSILPGASPAAPSKPAAKPASGKPAAKPGQPSRPAKVIKSTNAATMKALRAYKPKMAASLPGGPKGAQGAEAPEAFSPDVMSGEHDAAALERALEAWTPKEGVEAKEDKEEREEIAKANEQEKAAKEGESGAPGAHKQAAQRTSASSGNLPRASSGFQQLQRQQNNPSGLHNKLSASELSHAQQVESAHTAEAATKAKAATGRPLDAFALLNQAREQGVFYREDQHGGGHPEDQDDPELGAAVEETIRLLFGVRGILRVGPGRNEANEPVVVVVAGPGMTDVALSKVPPKVHKFDTLLAVSYELLPLRRER